MSLPRRRAVRLRAAMRRGSSSPVVVDDERGERWLVKLRGAAQGTGALVAECVVADLAEAIGLRVPARALLAIDAGLVNDVHDHELAELIARSQGDSLGIAWLEGARELVPATDLAGFDVELASHILWLDGLVMNLDRSAANPNLLHWRGRWWLIDHGAALTFAYAWSTLTEDMPRRPGPPHHLLAGRADRLAIDDDTLAALLTRETLHAAVDAVPDDFLAPLVGPQSSIARVREAYVAFLWKRLRPPRPFVPSALL